MKKYLVLLFKLVKAFLFFAFFKLAFNQLRVDFVGHANFITSYSDILVESVFFAVAWTLITMKFNKKRQKPESSLPKKDSIIAQ